MKRFKYLLIFVLLLIVFTLVPTIAANQIVFNQSSNSSDWLSSRPNQAPAYSPCELLDNPNLAPEYLSGGAESYLMRFCNGNSQPSAPFSNRGTGPSTPGNFAAMLNTLVNNRGDDIFPHITESETSIDTYDTNGDGLAEQVVMAWNGASNGNHGLGYGYSLDMGDTWTDVGLLANPAGHNNCCDPGVAVDSNGTFYISVLTFDGVGNGQLGLSTLVPPGVATVPTIIPGLISVDREDMAVDNTGTPATDGNIYVCYAEFGVAGTPVRVVRSTNGGGAWSAPINMTSAGQSGQGCRVEVGVGGEVFVTWHRSINANTAEIHIRKCTPGATECGNLGEWSADMTIDTVSRAQNPAAAAACGRPALNGNVRKTFENPTLAINPTTGRVHIAYSFKDNPNAADDANMRYQALNPDLTVAIPPAQINIDGTGTDQWRPFLSVTTGAAPVVGVAWYSRQFDDPGNLEFDVIKRVSFDDGLTFGVEERVTTASSPVPPLLPNFDPDVAGCYMSDYETMDADDGNFYIGWSDNRLTNNGIPDPDIRFFREGETADLSLTKSDSPDPVVAGTDLTYSIDVTNNGPLDSPGGTVTDTLPAGVSFSSSPDGCSETVPGSGIVTCGFGPLVNGATTSFTIIVTVDADLVYNAGGPTTITNTATVAGNSPDGDPSNNDASEDTMVVAEADLEILTFDFVDPPTDVVVGEDVDITLRKEITNNGPSAPMDTELTQTATAPPDSTVTPTMATSEELALGLNEVRVVTETFTINCGGFSQHTFTFTNEIQPLDPQDTDPDQSNNFATAELTVECVVPVAINIKPGSFPNSINPRSRGVIPVAVLTTMAGEYGLPLDFDATLIDPLSVRFGPRDAVWNETGGAFEAHDRGHIEDSIELDEVTMDGDDDMVLHFRTQETGIQAGDTEACVKGDWVDEGGTVHSFFGCDSVRTVPPHVNVLRFAGLSMALMPLGFLVFRLKPKKVVRTRRR